MASLSDLTIIILTYNRPKVILNQVQYLLRYQLKVLVLDGSIKSNDNLLNLQKLNKNLTYFWSDSGLAYRYRHAVRLIDTDYILTYTDDDFLAISGLEKVLISMLAEDIECAFGQYLIAYPLGSSWSFNSWNPPYFKLTDRSLTQADSLERSLHHFSTYVTTYIYCISKAENWKKVFEYFDVEPEQLSSPYLHELLIEYLAACYGRAKIFPYITGVRIKDNPPTLINAHESPMDNLSVSEWMNAKEYQNEINLLLETVVKILSPANLSENQIRKNFIECLKRFANLEIEKVNNMNPKTQSLWKLTIVKIRLSLKIRIYNFIYLVNPKSKKINISKQLNELVYANHIPFDAEDKRQFLLYLEKR